MSFCPIALFAFIGQKLIIFLPQNDNYEKHQTFNLKR